MIIVCILICLGVVLSFFIPKEAYAPNSIYQNNDPRPTGNTRRLSESTVGIQPLTDDGLVVDGQLGVGTFLSSHGYLLTAKHVIESGVYGVAVVDNDYPIINEAIITHPTEDLALMKLYNVATPCVTISPYQMDQTNQDSLQEITYPTEITPGMSGTPLYATDGSVHGIITQRDQTNTKKGQGTFLSPSIISRIESHLPKEYTTSCTVTLDTAKSS